MDGALMFHILASANGIYPGSETSPGFPVTGDPDTGIWSSGPNAIDVSIAGATRIHLSESDSLYYANFTSYTADGVFDVENGARPVTIRLPNGNSRFRFGYHDGGSGEYSPSLGMQFEASSYNPNLNCIQLRVQGDTANRFQITSGLRLQWGSGNAAIDTELYRSAADTLHTPDTFIVDINLAVGATAFGTNADKVIAIGDGTAPTTSPANTVQLYSEGGELKVRNGDGTVTNLSALTGPA